MSCLGVHFALADADVIALRAIDDEQDRLAHLQEDIEERYMTEPGPYVAESDKAWDAMHRVLGDGHLTWDGGTYPLNHAVLGGELLYTSDDYIMSLKSPAQVKDIAAALEAITEETFRVRYNKIPAGSTGESLATRTSCTPGNGSKMSESFTSERLPRDAMFCSQPTNSPPPNQAFYLLKRKGRWS